MYKYHLNITQETCKQRMTKYESILTYTVAKYTHSQLISSDY